MELPTEALAAATADDGLNTRAYLAEWLSDDLDEIRDPAAAGEFLAFADALRRALNESGGAAPAFVDAVFALSARLANEPDNERWLAILNDGLPALFLDNVLSDQAYEARCFAIRGGFSTLAPAVSGGAPARESLPASGTLAIFADDPREAGQCERAALLTVAVLDTLYARGAPTSTNVLVLVRGVAYAVRLEGTLRFGVLEWSEILRSIRDDSATVFATRHDAWVGVVPRLVTAAGRETCESIRRLLDCDRRNARALHGIDDYAFAVCLDAISLDDELSDGTSLERAEALARRYYSNVYNRWWGMTNVIVSATGEAALTASGRTASATLRASEDILARSFAMAPASSAAFDARALAVASLAIGRIDFREMHLGSLAIDAAREIAETFHDERSFFEIDIGSAFFRDRSVSAHAVLDYLFALAARDVFGSANLPALARLVDVRGRNDTETFDWVAMSTRTACALLSASDADNDADDDALFATSLEGIAFRHGVRIAGARRGYSPASFLRAPQGMLETMLDDYFIETGQRHAPGYRSHIVRDGFHEAIDIVTSIVRPAGDVRIHRCPGTTTTAATLFWADVELLTDRTNVYFIPNPRTKRRMGDVHRALRGLVRRLKSGAERLAAD